MILINGVKTNVHSAPVAGGSFADVYRGSYRGQDVAIKHVRLFLRRDESKKLFKVICVNSYRLSAFLS
jgi:hypothetical protein